MPIISTTESHLGRDPLTKAFQSVEPNYAWFTDEEKEKWKKGFLSGLTGSDLIDEIF